MKCLYSSGNYNNKKQKKNNKKIPYTARGFLLNANSFDILKSIHIIDNDSIKGFLEDFINNYFYSMEKEPVVTEEVTTPVVEEPITPEVSWDEITLEELLSELLPDTPSSEEAKEEIPNEPVFADAKKEDNEDTITEKELEELENEIWAVVEELEAEVETEKNTNKELSSQIEELSNKLLKAEETNNSVETAWQKVMTHPVIGELAMKLVKWEEIDIPKILEDKINEDIASMADITAQNPISIEPTKTSLWKRLWSMRTL